jgi:carbamoyl-phosphate synthase large subunit
MDLIRRARDFGLETVVADIDPACPGRSLADLFVEMDTSDGEAMVEVAHRYGVRLVLADQSDRVVPIAALINERLDLPGLRPDVAERVTDKSVMRRTLAGSVDMPAFAEVADVDAATAFAGSVGYPVVLKPKRAQSSIGVLKANAADEVRRAYPTTAAASTDGSILIEQFVDGLEVTVEAFSARGRCTVLALSEKNHYLFNDCLARRLSYPPRLEPEPLAHLREVAATVVEAVGLQDGLSHAEYRILDGTPYLIEVAARGGGSGIASRIVPHVSGVDVYTLLIRTLLGENVTVSASAARAAVLEFFDFPPGRVAAIRGVEQARREGLADELHLNFQAGDTILQPVDDRNRPGYALLLGETRDEVDARRRRLEELIEIKYAP